jgi:hypothetical protein
MDAQTAKRLNKVKDRHTDALFKKANVIGVYVDYKKVDGRRMKDRPCIVVMVSKKVGPGKLSKQDMVPMTLDGDLTDVIDAGGPFVAQEFDPTKKHRPAPPGVSIGHKNITAGTFGCVVKRGGLRFILSNNHVLANSNAAEMGDAIYQPGPVDGGTSADRIAALADFVPIVFESGGGGGGGGQPPCNISKGFAGAANLAAKALKRHSRLRAYNPADLNNEVDCAIARPLDDADITEQIVELGTPIGMGEVQGGEEVRKYGRTTRLTQGRVVTGNATVQVNYGGSNGLARFVSQIITSNMSQGGDSGSAVLDLEGRLVGLLFAGSDEYTILNHMSKVFQLLNLQL